MCIPVTPPKTLGLGDMRITMVLGRRSFLAKRIVRRPEDAEPASQRFDHLTGIERVFRHLAGA